MMLPVVNLQELLDYSYCPVSYWWRRVQKGYVPLDTSGRMSAEDLIREVVELGIAAYYKALGRGQAATVFEAFNYVWGKKIKEWGLPADVTKAMIEYHQRRQELLSKFGPGGNIKKADGGLYLRPMWTKMWASMAVQSGLNELAAIIDSHQTKVGMGPNIEVAENQFPVPGLAEAFADSVMMASKADEIGLPSVEQVVGTSVLVQVDLSHISIQYVADIVIDLGEKKRVGRPPQGEQAEHKSEVKHIAYELFLFEPTPPYGISVGRDLRLSALGNSRPVELLGEYDEISVDAVNMRHLFSGERAEITEYPAVTFLNSLARQFITAVRSNVYMPRMVNGWDACGECNYRPLCYSNSGIMDLFHAPIEAELTAALGLSDKLLETITAQATSLDAVRETLLLMAQTPGLSPDDVLWALAQ